MDAELIVDAKATLGEGPSWDTRRGRLFWVDIIEGRIHVYDPVSQSTQAIDIGQMVGAVAPRRNGGLILATHHGFASLDLDSGLLTPIADPECKLPRNRFNDGKCDPAGRFWAGTMNMDWLAGKSSLYCLDTNGTVRRVVEGVTCSNGIAWSVDRSTMYYIDTFQQRVDAFDYNVGTGDIANRRTVIVVPEAWGKPDGMTIDADGMLWIALWGGGCVSRWNPGCGVLVQRIPIPASLVSSCAFGGKNLDELYVTTARVRMTEEQLSRQPHSGGLFRIRGGLQGMPSVEFGG